MLTHAITRTVVGLAVGSLLLTGCGGDADDETATTSPPTEQTTTTTATAAPTEAQPESAVFPFASESTRFTDPVEAATAFAEDYLGYLDPTVGEFLQGDSRSGEVEIQAREDAPVTTVFVRQLTDDDTWWVLGAASANLQLTSPDVLEAISSPVDLAGQSTAFEGNVNVEIRQDGTVEPLGASFFTGGSMGDLAPFTHSVTFDEPTADGGAIVLLAMDMADGGVLEASVLRITFAG